MNNRCISRRGFLGSAGAAGVAAMAGRHALAAAGKPKPVRVAFIGVGSRGTGLLRQMLRLEGVEAPAICDINADHLDRAVEIVKQARGNTAAGFSKGPYDYRRMLERDDFDAVLIATPAVLHAEMAVDSLVAGKHVASEVPAAYTVDECWALVRAKEKTGKRYMLLENYTYAQSRMMVGNMVRAGVFGDCYYAECSYIHDCRNLRFQSDGTLTWRGESKRDMYGNLYPTHALGPVAKWLGLNRGDRMVSLVSQMSKPAAVHDYAVSRFGPDSKAAQIDFKAGDHSLTLIKTAKGRLIAVFYDSDSPRPASIFYLVQGTQGVYDSRSGIYIDGKSPEHTWEPAENYAGEYDHELWKTTGKEAAKSGHGGGDYLELLEFVAAVREDREPYIDVYDAASWSSVVELSARSIDAGGGRMEIPDFTGGRWEKWSL